MPAFDPGELVWFVHPEHGVNSALCFVRDHKSGAYIYGGHTGSHYTGHGEHWTKKLKEIQRLGYLPLASARNEGQLPHGWEPPEDEVRRDEIIWRIQHGEL